MFKCSRKKSILRRKLVLDPLDSNNDNNKKRKETRQENRALRQGIGILSKVSYRYLYYKESSYLKGIPSIFI